MTKAVVAFSLAAILALAGARSSFAQAPEPRFSERAFVTAIDVVIEVRDAGGKTPAGLTASDFRLLENGIERPIIGVEYLAGPASPAAAQEKSVPAAEARPEWQIVIWVDGLTTSRGTLQRSATELARHAGELARMGGVTVVYADLAPEVVLDASRDPAKIEGAIATVAERAPGDRIARIRREFLAFLEDRAKAGSNSVPVPLRDYVLEEERILRAGRSSLSRWLARLPRRLPRALIYVGDGFDLDPAEFYVSIIRSSGFQDFDAQQARLDGKTSAKEANYELARALAVGGWTVLAIGGTGANIFADDASRDAAGRVTSLYQGISAPSFLLQRPSEPLAQLAEETGGERIADGSKLRDALSDIGSRVRITYQVDREPDTAPHRIKIVPLRAGLTVRAPEWTSSTTAAALAEARAIELLGDGPPGDLPVVASLRPASSATEVPKLEARIDFAPLRDAAAQIGATKLRVTIAVAVAGAAPETFHAIVDVADLSSLPGLLWTAPIRLPENVGAIAVVAEELTSGTWGGARVGDRTAPSPETTAREDQPAASQSKLSIVTREEALARAAREKRPVISLEWGARCGLPCGAIEKALRTDPELVRRMEAFVQAGPAPGDAESRIALYGPTGGLFLSWPAIITTPREVRPLASGELLPILQSAAAAAPHLNRAAELAAGGAAVDARLEIALAYQRAGRAAEAEAAYGEAARGAKEAGDAAKEQTARVLGALMTAKLGNHRAALEVLRAITASAATPLNEAEAQLAIAQLLRAGGEEAGAAAALARALELAPRDSEAFRAALSLSGRDATQPGSAPSFHPVEIAVGGKPPFSGRTRVQVVVRDPAISSVAFRLDDATEIVDAKPPFEATFDLGPTPRRHEIRAIARDSGGRLSGEDVRLVNERHDEFWVRLRPAADADAIRAEMNVPAGSRVETIEFSVDGSPVPLLASDPPAIRRPGGSRSVVVRAVAKLDDGRSAEDAMLTGGAGFAETIEVRDVEIYAAVLDAKGAPLRDLDRSQFRVTEDGRQMDVAGFEFLGRTPVAIGIAIDSSSSMREIMTDVHRSARSFTDRAIRDGSSAFVVDFDTAPRLAAARTPDVAALRSALSRIEANGSTALYDAIIFGLLQLQGVPGKRALIVLSDGRDETSRYDVHDAIAVARESGVPIYMIARARRPSIPLPNRTGPPPSQSTVRRESIPRVGTTGINTSAAAGADPQLERIAVETGGRIWHLPEAADMDAIYAAIDLELSNQYRLTYRTTPGRGASDWRNVKVSVDVAGAKVRTAAGFIAR